MAFIVVKKHEGLPEEYAYFSHFDVIDNNKYPITTILKEHAYVFDTKEEAAKAYWAVSHFFLGYKIVQRI
jgi:hypothetical protein